MPRLILTIPVAVAMAVIAPVLYAGHSHPIGRYLGTGWSDGYHSRSACSPKRHILHASPQKSQPLPWWMIPAEDAESLPKTAPHERLPLPEATGPSLFRQPGEGSSVYPHSAPSIMR